MKKKPILKKSHYVSHLLSLGIFLFLFLLDINIVGTSLREKITMTSTLDFSWFSDLIERYLHGYLLGRDFTFTYGPLFQLFYSLPSVLFHVPSYISVAISPLLSFPILFLFVFIMCRFLTDDVWEQSSYLLFVFLILGVLSSSHTDTIRMLSSFVYALVVFKGFEEKNKLLFFFSIILPSIFGLYTYNLFVICLLIATLLTIWQIISNKRELIKQWTSIFIIPSIIIVQIAVSFLITHNFEYLSTSINAVVNYKYVMNLLWTYDRSNILLLFPIMLLPFGFIIWKTRDVSEKTKKSLLLFIFVSYVSLMYTISRSDAGHFLYAVYPSIITFFSSIFFLARNNKKIIGLGIIFYVLVPFKPTFYNTLAPKNILKIVSILKEKPSFFSIYKLPHEYYFSEEEVNQLASYSKVYKGSLYIYPYDSYILNMEGSTFNSYALGLYTYSNDKVEKQTVDEFSKHPPAHILLMIDTKGSLNLDDIANFTRNPLFASWIVRNYSISEKHPKYLFLTYDAHRKSLPHNTCYGYTLSFQLSNTESFIEKIIDHVKQPTYYLNKERIPYAPYTNKYLFFPDTTSLDGVSALFSPDPPSVNYETLFFHDKQLTITRISPFLHKKENIVLHDAQFHVSCATY